MKTRSLSFFVTVWMAVAIAASMAAYAIYEYAATPGQTAKELALAHLSHVLGLGVLIYTLCWTAFYSLLLRPLNRIYLHLYTIGAGRLTTLELDSRVREIRTIVDGVNLMLSRLKLAANENALEQAQARVAEIRELARQLTTPDHEHVTGLLDKLADLEKNLPGILAGQRAWQAVQVVAQAPVQAQDENRGNTQSRKPTHQAPAGHEGTP